MNKDAPCVLWTSERKREFCYKDDEIFHNTKAMKTDLYKRQEPWSYYSFFIPKSKWDCVFFSKKKLLYFLQVICTKGLTLVVQSLSDRPIYTKYAPLPISSYFILQRKPQNITFSMHSPFFNWFSSIGKMQLKLILYLITTGHTGFHQCTNEMINEPKMKLW